MKLYSKVLALMICCLFVSVVGSFAAAQNVYIAQVATGGADGSSCANAYAIGFFNSSGNWGTGPAQIGPGTTVHLCGTITTMLTFQAGGIPGNPITLLFDVSTSAKISVPYCNNTCITIGNNSYITIDGGTPCGPSTTCSSGNSGPGIIEATANGSTLANQQVSQAITTGSSVVPTNIEIRNLLIRNMYVHSTASDTSTGAGGGSGIFYQAGCSSCSAHDLTIHDVYVGIQNQGTDSGNTIYNDYIYHINWGVQHQTEGSEVTTNFSVHDTHISSAANWDTTGGVYHHDLLFLFNNSAGQGEFNGVYIYNNRFDGPMGNDSTAHIYFGGGGQINTYIYNNVFNNAGQSTGLGNSLLEPTGEARQQIFVFNNTIVGKGSGESPDGCVAMQGHITFVNNAVTACNGSDGLVLIQNGTYGTGAPTIVQINFNTYGTFGGTAFVSPSNSYTTLAGWQGYAGEANSTLNAGGLNLASNGSPNAGSPVINAGTNETSLCSGSVSALCSDTSYGDQRIPVARPSSGAWTVGAYNFSGGGGTVATPIFSPGAGTYPSTQSVTISTTTGGATLCYTTDGSTPTGNGAGTCTHGTTYSGAVSVSASLTLKAIGTESGFTDSALASAAYVINSGPAPAPAMFVIGTTAPCVTSPFNTWTNIIVPAQSANFEIQFDAIPSGAALDGVIGLAASKASQYTSLAVPIRFGQDGMIEAMNGSSYPPGSVPYTANVKYHVTEDVNMASHTYNAFIGTNSRTQIAKNYSFRTSAGVPASLGYLGLLQDLAQGAMTVCNAAVLNYPPPTATLKNRRKNL